MTAGLHPIIGCDHGQEITAKDFLSMQRVELKMWARRSSGWLVAAASMTVMMCCGAAHAAGKPAADKPATSTTVTYTTDAEGAHQADLFEPQATEAAAAPFAAIVYIHGGSWRSGNRHHFDRMAADLAAQGYVGFSIDYDLHPKSFPLSWEEARAAVEYLRAHAAQYRVDPQRIAVVGTSAGGEIAALMGLDPRGPASAQGAAVPLQAVVLLNAVFNLHGDYHVIHRYLGGTCDQIGSVCNEASPIDQVHADAPVHGAAPPFFVGHGTSDHVVPYAQSQIFIHALQTAEIPVTPFVASGGPHMYWTKSKFYAHNLMAMESFLARTLAH
jgi:acetyl esterase/lipase